MEIIKQTPETWKVPLEINDGNLHRIVSRDDEADDTVENFIFRATLEFVRFERMQGYASRYFFRTLTGVHLLFSPTAIRDLFKAVKSTDVVTVDNDGNFRGVWTFAKHGPNCTCRPLSSEEFVQYDLDV